jgi:predicted  nucleic acid-binding Zn-ribbon protein
MAYKRKSKKAAADVAEAAAEAPAETQEATEHSHSKLESKIATLEAKVVDLENKLNGVLSSVEALSHVKSELEALSSKLKSELDEAKLKISVEVNELKEKAKSWKEKADSNQDGSLDWEELFQYVMQRKAGRSIARALKSAKE